jgi:hypothetical protein
LPGIIFGFWRQQSCLPKALELLFDTPFPAPNKNFLKLVTKKPSMTHLMSIDMSAWYLVDDSTVDGQDDYFQLKFFSTH